MTKYHCFVALKYHCFVALKYHCFVALKYHSFVALKYRCFVALIVIIICYVLYFPVGDVIMNFNTNKSRMMDLT